jgi:hypothetical protein
MLEGMMSIADLTNTFHPGVGVVDGVTAALSTVNELHLGGPAADIGAPVAPLTFTAVGHDLTMLLVGKGFFGSSPGPVSGDPGLGAWDY